MNKNNNFCALNLSPALVALVVGTVIEEGNDNIPVEP